MGIKAKDLGPDVPRRGNAVGQFVGELLLKLLGWEVAGIPLSAPKAMFIGAPHTSNRDGLIAVAVMLALRLRINVMMKAELFVGPFGKLFHWFGMRPVYRSKSMGLVEQSAQQYRETDKLYLGIAPEGTRHASKAWKLGFYHIAVLAEVPIQPFSLNFGERKLEFFPLFHPTGDAEADLKYLMGLYRGIVPADPSRLSIPLRELNEKSGKE
ncbi:MAG: 1-acyl-sn-glycerol-3-phosphate acyltransferase [Pseudomonadota bacterium]